MLRTRVIPCLQLIEDSLVKTVKFQKPSYIGDPINTVRIFNELEVDELCFLDIRASYENRLPNFELLNQIADECFMPLSYGGGIKDGATAKEILAMGFEKIVINSAFFETPSLIKQIIQQSGSQSLIGAIDVKKKFWGKHYVYAKSGTINKKKKPISWAKELENYGVGEILLTSINKEGTWSGYDLDLIKAVSEAVTIPVIANGGASSLQDLSNAVNKCSASAVGLGNMVVYQQKGMGVLINFPNQKELQEIFNS